MSGFFIKLNNIFSRESRSFASGWSVAVQIIRGINSWKCNEQKLLPTENGRARRNVVPIVTVISYLSLCQQHIGHNVG